MRQSTATVERVTLLAPGMAEVRLACEAGAVPQPGQFTLARWDGSPHYLRRALFPRSLDQRGFTVEIAEPLDHSTEWMAGSSVDLLGPMGNALRFPESAGRYLLIDSGRGPDRLLPVVQAGLRRGAAVALLLGRQDYPLHLLPPEIEVRPAEWDEALPEALAWADFVLADAGAPEWPAVHAAIERARPFASRRPVHVLITPTMPCGVGACGACAVEVRGGWKWACVDGPIFAWMEEGRKT